MIGRIGSLTPLASRVSIASAWKRVFSRGYWNPIEPVRGSRWQARGRRGEFCVISLVGPLSTDRPHEADAVHVRRILSAALHESALEIAAVLAVAALLGCAGRGGQTEPLRLGWDFARQSAAAASRVETGSRVPGGRLNPPAVKRSTRAGSWPWPAEQQAAAQDQKGGDKPKAGAEDEGGPPGHRPGRRTPRTFSPFRRRPRR